MASHDRQPIETIREKVKALEACQACQLCDWHDGGIKGCRKCLGSLYKELRLTRFNLGYYRTLQHSRSQGGIKEIVTALETCEACQLCSWSNGGKKGCQKCLGRLYTELRLTRFNLDQYRTLLKPNVRAVRSRTT